jgi:hypothetical protein
MEGKGEAKGALRNLLRQQKGAFRIWGETKRNIASEGS